MDANPFGHKARSQAIVAGVGRGGHHDLIQPLGAFEPLDLAQDHRLTDKVRHHLAGQAGRAHAGLQDGEGQGGGPSVT